MAKKASHEDRSKNRLRQEESVSVSVPVRFVVQEHYARSHHFDFRLEKLNAIKTRVKSLE